MKTLITISRGICMSLTALFLLAIPSNLKADIGNFDIIELSDGHSIIYISTHSRGLLRNHDLCYYDWNGEFKINIETLLKNEFSDQDSFEIYTSLEKIYLSKFDQSYEDFNSTLYIISGQSMISKKDFFDKYEVIDAYNGNTYGFTYTQSLNSSDNAWLGDYQIEQLFTFNDYELCGMALYGIKNNLSKIEVLRIKVDLDTLLKEHKHKEFNEMLDNLRLKNIIMIGFCSC